VALPLPIGLPGPQNRPQIGEKLKLGAPVNFHRTLLSRTVVLASISTLAPFDAGSMVGSFPDASGAVVTLNELTKAVRFCAVNGLQRMTGEGLCATPTIQGAL
jgi:hypothetical protein